MFLCSKIKIKANILARAHTLPKLAAIIMSIYLFAPTQEAYACSSGDGAKDCTNKTISLLTIKFQNDHDIQEPTTGAEKSRLKLIEDTFTTLLQNSGQFRFIPVPEQLKNKINNGQFMGECGGCEFDYGKEIGSDIVAWIVVQKVSNLILNINVYVVDVVKQTTILVQSVDIRGNTDESWTRGMRYLVNNHILRK